MDKREAVAHKTALVSNDEVLKNGSNLSVSSYVEPEDTSEKIDIKVLNAQIAEIVKKEAELRTAIDRIVAELAEKLTCGISGISLLRHGISSMNTTVTSC